MRVRDDMRTRDDVRARDYMIARHDMRARENMTAHDDMRAGDNIRKMEKLIYQKRPKNVENETKIYVKTPPKNHVYAHHIFGINCIQSRF